jgi:hypothetical protein
MALTLDALEGSPRSREGGHALTSCDFGPLSKLICNLGNIYGIRHEIKWLATDGFLKELKYSIVDDDIWT